MEAARYGDTNGYQTDGPRDMWRWRDWVIDAFNRNMPFDQFTVEQLAGDLLPNATLDQRIATGFNRNHRTSGEGGIIPEEYRVEYVADRAQTTATVWLGLTVGLRPLPRPQVRSDHAEGLLPALRLLQPDSRRARASSGTTATRSRSSRRRCPDQQKRLAELDRRAGTARIAAAVGERACQGRLRGRAGERTSGRQARDLVPRPADAFDGRQYKRRQLAEFDYLQPFTYAAAGSTRASPDGAILSRARRLLRRARATDST